MPRRIDHDRVVELVGKGLAKDVVARRMRCSVRSVDRILAERRKEAGA